MHTSNVDKLVAAKLIEVRDLTEKDHEIIEALSHHEIDAIITAGHKFQKLEESGVHAPRIVF